MKGDGKVEEVSIYFPEHEGDGLYTRVTVGFPALGQCRHALPAGCARIVTIKHGKR